MSQAVSAPSFADDRIKARFALLKKKARPGLVTFITANDPTPDVFREIVRQRSAGQKAIIGAMLESYLVGGSQKFPQPKERLMRGQSTTDACMDWETTEAVLREAHAAL